MSYEINYNEEPKIYIEHGGTVWKRTGYCCQCGSCCEGCPIKAFKWLDEGKRGICLQRTSSYYLSGCNVWPAHPEQIRFHPKCTYKFEVVNAT